MPLKPFKDSLAQGMFQTNKNISGTTNPLNQNTPNSMVQPYQRRNFGGSDVPYMGQEAITGGGAGGQQVMGGGPGGPDQGGGGGYIDPGAGGGTGGGGGDDDDTPTNDWQDEWNQFYSDALASGLIDPLQFDWASFQPQFFNMLNTGTSYDDIWDFFVSSFTQEEEEVTGDDVPTEENVQITPQGSRARRGRGTFEMQGRGDTTGFAARGSFLSDFLKKQEQGI